MYVKLGRERAKCIYFPPLLPWPVLFSPTRNPHPAFLLLLSLDLLLLHFSLSSCSFSPPLAPQSQLIWRSTHRGRSHSLWALYPCKWLGGWHLLYFVPKIAQNIDCSEIDITSVTNGTSKLSLWPSGSDYSSGESILWFLFKSFNYPNFSSY